MGGLAVLFIVGLFVLIAYKAVRASERRWVKAVVVVVAVLIPSADAIYGRIKLKHMCETEAGLKVYRVAEHVEGFMDEGISRDYWVKEQSFKFSEDPLRSNGTTTRYSRQIDGQIIKEEHVFPKSQYRLRYVYPNTKAVYNHYGYSIENIATGEVLATHIWVAFNGGWAERFLAMSSDAGGGNVALCSNDQPALYIDKLVNSTLKH